MALMGREIAAAAAGALFGGLATGVLSPLIEKRLNVYFEAKYWDGTWETMTCHRQGFNGMGKDHAKYPWLLSISQDGNSVSGSYKFGTRENAVDGFNGLVAGNLEGRTLKGVWTQVTDGGAERGEIFFQISNDGNRFDGTYTNELREMTRQWVGAKDGSAPLCAFEEGYVSP